MKASLCIVLMHIAGAAVAATVLPKDDARIWQTVFSPSEPLAWRWAESSTSAEVINTANGWEDNKTTGQSGRDPYGNTIAAGQSMTRVCRGTGYADGAGAATELVGTRRTSVTTTNPNGTINACAVRLAIHLSDPRR